MISLLITNGVTVIPFATQPRVDMDWIHPWIGFNWIGWDHLNQFNLIQSTDGSNPCLLGVGLDRAKEFGPIFISELSATSWNGFGC